MNRSLSDNSVFKVSNRLGEYFLLSIYWIVCSLPVLTMGAATIALYDAVSRSIRKNEGTITRRFFRTFKNELLRGGLLTVIWALIGVVMAVGYYSLYQNGQTSQFWAIASLIYLVTLFVPVGTLCWAIAIESRFVYSLGQLLKNAFVFTFSYLPHTAAVVAVLILSGWLVWITPLSLIAVPAVAAHLQSFFIEKVLVKYMPEEPAEE